MLRAEPTLWELFSDSGTDAAVIGFACAQLHDVAEPVLWIQDRLSRRESGRPCLSGLPQPIKLLHVTVNRAVDVLWAMEEGLHCAALSAVVGEVWGNPPALDFTASKRLAMRAEAKSIPTLLIRRAAEANLSAARMRWRIASLAAEPDPYDQRAPGKPMWQADLFRARGRSPAQWVAQHDGKGVRYSHGLHSAVPVAGGHDAPHQANG